MGVFGVDKGEALSPGELKHEVCDRLAVKVCPNRHWTWLPCPSEDRDAEQEPQPRALEPARAEERCQGRGVQRVEQLRRPPKDHLGPDFLRTPSFDQRKDFPNRAGAVGDQIERPCVSKVRDLGVAAGRAQTDGRRDGKEATVLKARSRLLVLPHRPPTVPLRAAAVPRLTLQVHV